LKPKLTVLKARFGDTTEDLAGTGRTLTSDDLRFIRETLA